MVPYILARMFHLYVNIWQTTNLNLQMSVIQNTVNKLKLRIKQGYYAPGQRLIERDLEKDLNVGRGTVREALRRLAGDGFVVQEANRGTSIRSLSRSDVMHIYTVREVIEGLAARLAAENITIGNNMKRLESALHDMRAISNKGEYLKYMEHNESLHQLIIEISANPWLPGIAEQLWLPIFRIQFNRFIQANSMQESLTGHEQIIKAILDGDGPKAEKIMREHIRSSQKVVQLIPEEFFGS